MWRKGRSEDRAGQRQGEDLGGRNRGRGSGHGSGEHKLERIRRPGSEPGLFGHWLGDPEPLVPLFNPYLLHRVVGGLHGITPEGRE